MGTSFGEWLRNYRISEAMILIAQGMSILEASLDVGYDSQTAFGKVFKRRVGITPVHYAAQFRKLTASSRQSD
ncbi:helix-turn-helix transcriptional regulator [Vibrio sp.]|uniref:helix-turn-helix domain-containing protein n=1 Tax=Vibrio viridaestus TaxID=2487322 RepID=UPI001FB7D0D5|nr:helix-turn-helix transcriptional regulator [Vibrio viridaestus]MDC0610269.1 helix-turn-helix transcriptional regulator [Vibrio sp.]